MRIAGRVIKHIVADFEGVVGPPAETLVTGAKLRDNRLDFIARRFNLQVNDALEFGRNLRRKIGTDSYEHMFVRSGISLRAYTREVYHPIMDDIKREVRRDSELISLVRKVELPKVILSNTVGIYVRGVLDAQGLSEHFNPIFTAESLGNTAKPLRSAYVLLLANTDFDPKMTIYFDDRPANLKVPYQLGMLTVLIDSGADKAKQQHAQYTFATFKDALASMF